VDELLPLLAIVANICDEKAAKVRKARRPARTD